MDHDELKARQALLELPEEAFTYLFPFLKSQDLYRMLGLDAVSYSIIPDKHSTSRTSGWFPDEEKDEPRYCFGPRSSKEEQPEEDDAAIEQMIREDDERGERIRAAIARVQEEFGVTREELRDALDLHHLPYSHLRITRSGRILLTDYMTGK